MFHGIARYAGKQLARFLNQSTRDYSQFAVTPTDRLLGVLRPGDVLLVEGKTRISTAIKYLTQSTWSHAALYVGDAAACQGSEADHVLVEADLEHGVLTVPLIKYARYNTRICRAVGLSVEDRQSVVAFACKHIGYRYDLKNIFDLLRFFIPVPPVPVRYRRRLLAFGSGDPTRAICSTLIAQGFHEIGYPILPRSVDYTHVPQDPEAEVMIRRHYSHFVPRDFDISPYFRIVKPTLEMGFDYRSIVWREDTGPPPDRH